MSRNPFNARLLSSMLMAGALVLTGCTDNDYDFNEIDATVGIGGDGLEIPASTTEDIKLIDVLELEEDGSVVEDAITHDYVFRQTGDPIDPVRVSIDKIHVAYHSGSSIDFAFDVPSNAKGGARKAAAVVKADADIYEFHYSGDKPDEVISISSAEAATTLTLNVPLTRINSAVPTMNEMAITLPSYLKFKVNKNSVQPTSINGSKLVFSNVSTNKDFKLIVDVTGLDFTSAVTSGSIAIGKKVDLRGVIHLTASGAITGTLTSAPTMKAGFSMDDFVINAATGRFDPDINLENGLGNADITGIPDFLTDSNVKVDLYNPQILLTIGNDMDAEGTITGSIISKKDGKVINRIDGVKIPVGANVQNKVCINRTGEAKAGYTVVKVPNLSDAIMTIPDNVEFTATAKVNSEKVTTFKLGHNYYLTPSYTIEAPIAFAENAQIVYKDTIDDWNDDIKDLELAENTYISFTANVTSKVPAHLSVEAMPIGMDKKEVKGIKIEFPDGKNKVAGAASVGEPKTSPIEIKITQTEKGALKKLDGLTFTISGKAQEEGQPTLTGTTLNAQNHTLTAKDIKIKIVGKVIGDFN